MLIHFCHLLLFYIQFYFLKTAFAKKEKLDLTAMTTSLFFNSNKAEHIENKQKKHS